MLVLLQVQQANMTQTKSGQCCCNDTWFRFWRWMFCDQSNNDVYNCQDEEEQSVTSHQWVYKQGWKKKQRWKSKTTMNVLRVTALLQSKSPGNAAWRKHRSATITYIH